jgi:aminodeoxyfutalosine deaminase
MFKLSSSQLFDGNTMYDANHVIIFNNEGYVIDRLSITDAGDDVYITNKLVTPGLVNVHCHVELSHYYNCIPQHTGLVDFLEAVINVKAANILHDQANALMQQAEQSMINDGIIAVGDICNTTDSLAIKIKEKLYYKNFIEALGFVPEMANTRFNEAMQVQKNFEQHHLPATIVPHAAYSVSQPLLNLINSHSKGNTISIHNQEAAAENEFFKHKQGRFTAFYKNKFNIDLSFMQPTGTTSMQYVMPYCNNANAVIWVHNTFTNSNDMALLNNSTQQHYWCLCPNANLYIENILPNVPLLIHSKIPLVIGTDSLASNHSLSIQAEVNTLKQHFPNIDATIWYKAATSNGANALGISQWAGSFDIGKKPGWVAWNT